MRYIALIPCKIILISNSLTPSFSSLSDTILEMLSLECLWLCWLQGRVRSFTVLDPVNNAIENIVLLQTCISVRWYSLEALTLLFCFTLKNYSGKKTSGTASGNRKENDLSVFKRKGVLWRVLMAIILIFKN